MYVGCEHAEEAGVVLVELLFVNMYDDDQTAVMFDYPAWDAASFDAVTNVWINGILVVDQSSVILYVDGEAVEDLHLAFLMGHDHQFHTMSGQRWMIN